MLQLTAWTLDSLEAIALRYRVDVCLPFRGVSDLGFAIICSEAEPVLIVKYVDNSVSTTNHLSLIKRQGIPKKKIYIHIIIITHCLSQIDSSAKFALHTPDNPLRRISQNASHVKLLSQDKCDQEWAKPDNSTSTLTRISNHQFIQETTPLIFKLIGSDHLN